MANQIEVILGTYEGYLVGYKFGYNKNGEETLVQSFADNNHSGSVKCIAISGKYIASGGVDERIYVYDMLKRREIQLLMHHEGTVNTLMFTPEATHLFSGSEDGKMCAVRVGNWQLQATWKKAHGGSPVYSISSHPSGKLALTIGKDLTLRTWNLIKGRIIYVKNLKSISELERHADCIAWSADGNYFSIAGLKVIEIWCIDNPGMVIQEKCESKPICACWVDNTAIFGLENGKLLMATITDEKSSAEIIMVKAYENERVKCISYINDVLATASSSGEICLWKFNQLNKEIEKICSVNIGCRPTCMDLLDLKQFDENYIIKLENKEEEKVFEKNNCSQKNEEFVREKPDNGGYVVVEYEDDELKQDNEDNSLSQKEETKDNSLSQKEETKDVLENLTDNNNITNQKKKRGRKRKNASNDSNINLLKNEKVSKKITESEDNPKKEKHSSTEWIEESVESNTEIDNEELSKNTRLSKKKRKSVGNSEKKKRKSSVNLMDSSFENIDEDTNDGEFSKSISNESKNKLRLRTRKRDYSESNSSMRSFRSPKSEYEFDSVETTNVRNKKK